MLADVAWILTMSDALHGLHNVQLQHNDGFASHRQSSQFDQSYDKLLQTNCYGQTVTDKLSKASFEKDLRRCPPREPPYAAFWFKIVNYHIPEK
jgi:hypothetical protein